MGNLALPSNIGHLTPDYLTTALRHGGHLRDGRVAAVEARPVGAGVGFVGQLAHLTLRYHGDAGGLPTTMVAKFPTEYPSAKDIAQAYGFYRAEAECYRQARHGELGVPTPAIFLSEVSDDDRETLILMEDLSDARMADQVTGASLEDARAVIDVGAQLHATWWESPRLDELAWLRPLNNPAYKAGEAQYRQCFPGFLELVGEHLPSGSVPIAEGMGHRLVALYDDIVATRPLTLSHVDFRLDNFFFDRPGAPVTVIDWQLSVRSVGIGDIAYFLIQSMTTEMRRAHGEELVRRWHDGVVDRGVTGYSLDEAWSDLRMCALIQLAIPVVSSINLDLGNDRAMAFMHAIAQRSCQALLDYDCGAIDLD